ncbi:radical SAM protein [Thermodesulfobacteriota bacterium]
MTLKVNEIFYSIQGESAYSGKPCAFVRLTGCNLRCTYCDTAYAYYEGTSMNIEDIAEKIESFGCSLVEITGGEPLLQSETPQLIAVLLDRGYRLLLETNGSKNIGVVDKRCVRIMDIKCPSSGEEKNNDLENLNRLNPGDEIKFVIADRVDYDFARDILGHVPYNKTGISVNFSPCFSEINPDELASWILDDKLDVRLNLQLHKYIWPPDTRGV